MMLIIITQVVLFLYQDFASPVAFALMVLVQIRDIYLGFQEISLLNDKLDALESLPTPYTTTKAIPGIMNSETEIKKKELAKPLL